MSMKSIGIFYGSSTGATKAVAEKLAKIMNVSEDDVHDVAQSAPSDVALYETLILGTSTWGAGQIQENWYDFLAGLEALDLKDRKIALFGLGDETMKDTFCDGVATLYDVAVKTGATLVGEYDTDGYIFDSSKAIKDNGMAVGLLLDDVNHPELTDFRLRSWAGKLLES